MNIKHLAVATLAVAASSAIAAPYNYTVWTASSSSSATGTVGGAGVTFTGPLDGILSNTQNPYYAAYPGDYTSSTVSNAPAVSDNFIQLQGGNQNTYSLTFTKPVNNLVISVLSLGAGGPAEFDFNKSFSILSQGPDQWGGSNTSLSIVGNNLVGSEGSGSILFSGSTTTLSWTLPTLEYWYGFTAATPVATPEPSSIAIFGVGALGLLIRRKRQSR